MKVYVISYCQNEYQREGARNLVEENGGEIVNPDFSKRVERGVESGRLDFDVDTEKGLLMQADEGWVLGWFCWGVCQLEKVAEDEGIFLRYFKLNHIGKYVGKGVEVNREELLPVGGLKRRLMGVEDGG